MAELDKCEVDAFAAPSEVSEGDRGEIEEEGVGRDAGESVELLGL